MGKGEQESGGTPDLRVPINPHHLYTRPRLERMLGVERRSITRAIREGQLRVSRRCGRQWFLGSWVLDWIKAGEVPPTMPNRSRR